MYRFAFIAVLLGLSTSAWSQDAPAVPAETVPAASPEKAPAVPVKAVSPEVKEKIEKALETKPAVEVVPAALEVPTPRPMNMEPKAVAKAVPEKDASGVEFSGYLRARYGAVLDGDGNPDFVGLNDGFSLDNARITLDAERGKARLRVAIDGAVDRRSARNTAQGRVDVGLKDAYIAYGLTSGIDFVIGQFKPPFDAEEQQATLDMVFVERSVASRGVMGTEGYNIDGLSLDRQAGVMVRRRAQAQDDKRMYVDWALAATNGSGANRPTNDNDRLAYTGRLAFNYGGLLSVGAAVNHNEFTNGTPPDLLVDKLFGIAADLTVRTKVAGRRLELAAQLIRTETTSKDVPTEPKTVAMGYHASLGIEVHSAVYLAYRFATLDPTASFDTEDQVTQVTLDSDAVTYHTIGLNVSPRGAPCGLKLNYTQTGEQAPRELANDRLDVLVQAAF